MYIISGTALVSYSSTDRKISGNMLGNGFPYHKVDQFQPFSSTAKFIKTRMEFPLYEKLVKQLLGSDSSCNNGRVRFDFQLKVLCSKAKYYSLAHFYTKTITRTTLHTFHSISYFPSHIRDSATEMECRKKTLTFVPKRLVLKREPKNIPLGVWNDTAYLRLIHLIVRLVNLTRWGTIIILNWIPVESHTQKIAVYVQSVLKDCWKFPGITQIPLQHDLQVI